MSHHLGDALYRNASGNQQGSEGVPGLVEKPLNFDPFGHADDGNGGENKIYTNE